jgi:hypothetical protein
MLPLDRPFTDPANILAKTLEIFPLMIYKERTSQYANADGHNPSAKRDSHKAHKGFLL